MTEPSTGGGGLLALDTNASRDAAMTYAPNSARPDLLGGGESAHT